MSNPSYEEREKAKQSEEDWAEIEADADEVRFARLLLELERRVRELEFTTAKLGNQLYGFTPIR